MGSVRLVHVYGTVGTWVRYGWYMVRYGWYMGTVRYGRYMGTVRYGHGYGTVGTRVWYSKYMGMVLGCRCMGTSWCEQNVGPGQGIVRQDPL